MALVPPPVWDLWVRPSFTFIALSLPAIFFYGCGESIPSSGETEKSIPTPIQPSNSIPELSAVSDTSEQVRELIAQLSSTRTRDEAYANLASSLTSSDLPLLHEALTASSSDSARWRIASLIGHVGDQSSVDPLRRALRDDESYYVRRNAAYALGWIADARAVEDLRRAMQSDEDTSVRKRSAWAIERILGARADSPIREAIAREQDAGVKLSHEWLLNPVYREERTTSPALKPGEIVEASNRGTYYLFYLPTTYDPAGRTPLLVSVHGTDGRPESYMEMCLGDAERYGVAVVAPYFDYPTFPNYDLLEIALDGVRADLRLFEILDQVAQVAPVEVDDFYLFGHSKGGQFVSRMVLAHFDRLIAAAAGGPGHFVASNPDATFPTGTKSHPLAPDIGPFKFAVLVRSRLAIVLGENELQRRIDEANNFMADVQGYADQNGVHSRVELLWVRGGGHSGRNNWPVASAFLFRDLAESR